MNFTDRKDEAEGMVLSFLSDYAPPRGMDEAQLSARVSHIADAFARRMPIGPEYAEKVDGVLMRVRDTHESNTWPPQAAFVAHMPRGEMRKGAPATYQSENPDRIAEHMAQGYAVPEAEVWKSQAVNPEVLDRYRHAVCDNWMDTYRSAAQPMLVEKYGAIVNRYFMEPA